MRRLHLFAFVLVFVSLWPELAPALQEKAQRLETQEAAEVQREKARLRVLANLQGIGCAPSVALAETTEQIQMQSVELRFSEAGREATVLELKNPGSEPVSIAVTVPHAAGGQSVNFSICPQATAVLELATLVAQDQDRMWVKLRGDVTASVVLRNVPGAPAKQRFAVQTDFEVNRLLIFAGPEDRYQLESETEPAAVESNFRLRDGSSAHSVREEASALSMLEPPNDAQSGVVGLAFGRRLRGGQTR